MRSRRHEVHIITSRWRAADAPREETGVERALHLQWGPPYPPEHLAGLLAAEASDRQLIQRRLNEIPPDVIDIWGMEFASQSLVAALAAGPFAVHLTLEDVWLQHTYQYDPIASLRRVTDTLGVTMPAAIADLCCLPAGPPDIAAAEVSFVSNALALRYRQAGFEHPHQHVRFAGIDLSRFSSAEPANPPPFVILYVGQLTAARGAEDLIQAVAAAAPDDADLTLRFVGGGSAAYLNELEQLAARHAQPRLRIDFAGPLDPTEIPTVYRDVHLFVHPSRLPEGLPIVLMEAIASGVPVIAADGGGQRDILDGGKWGELIPPGDVTAMSAAIRAAIDNRGRWQQRAAHARRHAWKSFDIERYVDGHLDDLRTAADRDRPSTPMTPIDPQAISDASAAFRDHLAAAARAAAPALDTSADPDGAWRLAVVLKRCAALTDARTLFERLMQTGRATDVRRASFHLAEIAIAQRDWSDAERKLRHCLEIAPDHRKAFYDLEFTKRREVPPHLIELAI